jgi:uncharacterized protein
MLQTASFPVDQAPQELNFSSKEELVEPTQETPTTRQERISSMDILRGVALLGIFLSNILVFAEPSADVIPLLLPKPAFIGPHAHLNLILCFFNYTFVTAKMRGIFSILFGAGVVLLTSRAEQRGAYKTVADIFLRRNMWLAAFGILHAYFIWDGDILFYYGITALLFLYPCRHLKARTLLTVGVLIALIPSTYAYLRFKDSLDNVILSRQAAVAAADQKAGKRLTDAQKYELRAWTEKLTPKKTTPKQIEDKMTEAHQGYLTRLNHQSQTMMHIEADVYYRVVYADVLGMMLIGMGLIKTGFLSAELSYAPYLWTALLGFLLSVPLSVLGLVKVWRSGFAPGTISIWLHLPNYVTRLGATLAITAAVLILIKSGTFRFLTKPLAAVGQMALTNYLMTSVICQFVFLWSPWKLFGKLEYFQLYYCVLAMWTINLIFSSIWLRYFNFGPVEWLWRSLTYWKRQPLLSRTA